MEKIYKIGRLNNGNDVIINHKSISKYHAELKVDSTGKMVLVDKDSAGGTFVNGREIVTKTVSIADTVTLYLVPLPWHKHFVIRNNQIKGTRLPNDFSEEFYKLKAVYEKYEKEKEELRLKEDRMKFIQRLLYTLTSLSTIAFLVFGDEDNIIMRVVLAVIIAVIMIILSIIIDAPSARKKRRDNNNKLDRALKSQYLCPNPDCKSRPLAIRPWEDLARRKKHKCGAIWVK